MKNLLQFAFAAVTALSVQVTDSSAADRYSSDRQRISNLSRTSYSGGSGFFKITVTVEDGGLDGNLLHRQTPTTVERPVFGPHILTFMTDEDRAELEFLMRLGVDLRPDREGYFDQWTSSSPLHLEGNVGNDR